MTVPLAVRLRTAEGDRFITRRVTALSYTTKERGGFASAKLRFARRLTDAPLSQFDEVAIFDAHSGEVAWEGRIDAPARRSGANGQDVEVIALGEGIASMTDSKTPYMIVDSELDAWDEQISSQKDLSVRTGSSPGSDLPGLTFDARGEVVSGNGTIAWYRNLHRCGQLVGAITLTHIEGEGGLRALDLRIGNSPPDSTTVLFSWPWSTGLVNRFVAFTPGLWPAAQTLKLGWRFTGDGTVGQNAWSTLRSVSVYARLLGKDRQPRPTTDYSSTPFVKIGHVFTDVVARFCPRLDIENARIDDGTFTYTQLAWPTAIEPDQVMDEVLEHEPDFTWAVWEKQPNGKWRTELRSRETQVRYDATVQDGYDAVSPASEVYNRVAVLWRDSDGTEQVTWVTSDVPALTAAGVTRTATINLGREQGTAAQALQRGTAFLADHDVQPNGGNLSIAGRIWDRIDGRWVDPWMIRAGALIRTRGVQSTPDDLNATSPNGVTVARIVATSFDAGTGIADLDLDVPALTEQRLLAQLANARSRG